MPSLDLLRRHLLVTVAVAGLLLGGIVGLFVPIRAAPFPKTSSEAWTLPSLGDTKRFREDAYTALRAARFWKTVAGTGQQGAPKVEWTLTGIITRPRLMAAVGQTGNGRASVPGDKPASNLVAVGAELPDGSTLLRVTRDAIWFEKDGCVRERRLYRAITAENNACLGEPTPGPATPDTTAPAKATTPDVSKPAAASPRPDSGPARSTTPKPPTRPAMQAAGAATP